MNHPEKLHFAHLPTPIEYLPRLSAELGGPEIYVKRDDQTGLAFGGNKTRKLEFLLADALRNGAKTVITTGAVQSNHCRQTAAAAARVGLDCVLVLSGKDDETLSGNLLLDHLVNARIVWTSPNEREEALQNAFQELAKDGRRPYLIPYGGSNPIGASAYAYAFLELKEQIDSGGIELSRMPGWVVFATSSGGTQSGMLVGAKLAGFNGKILGISVDVEAELLQQRIYKLANETAQYLGTEKYIEEKEVIVNSNYLGGGYGVAGAREIDAIKIFARLEGLLLDPVYTGKAAGGMLDLISSGFFSQNDIILFWHTGGTPALFAERYRDIFNDRY